MPPPPHEDVMAKKKVEEQVVENAPVRARAETFFDKNGAGVTRISADLLLGPNRPCVVVLADGRSFHAGLTGPAGEVSVGVPPFSGPFVIKVDRKDDDAVYAEGVA